MQTKRTNGSTLESPPTSQASEILDKQYVLGAPKSLRRASRFRISGLD